MATLAFAWLLVAGCVLAAVFAAFALASTKEGERRATRIAWGLAAATAGLLALLLWRAHPCTWQPP